MTEDNLEGKVRLVKNFQAFAQAQGLHFSYKQGFIKHSCYKEVAKKDKPRYFVYTSPSDQIVDNPNVSYHRFWIMAETKKYKLKAKGPNVDVHVYKTTTYSHSKLMPSHLKLDPVSLLWLVAHEGTHMSVRKKKARLSSQVEESFANATGYALTKRFAEHTGEYSKEDVEAFSHQHSLFDAFIARWEHEFNTLYAQEKERDLVFKRRLILMQEMGKEAHALAPQITSDLIRRRLFEGDYNNAYLARHKNYSKYFDQMVKVFEELVPIDFPSGQFDGALQFVNTLPKDQKKLEAILL